MPTLAKLAQEICHDIDTGHHGQVAMKLTDLKELARNAKPEELEYAMKIVQEAEQRVLEEFQSIKETLHGETAT